MNVCVVGGAGYIGSVLCRQLLAKGHSVRVLDNLLFGGESIVGLLPLGEFDFVYGDIRSQKDVLSAVENIDIVVNLAAMVGEHHCLTDPKAANDINYQGACELAEIALKKDINRLIFVSTCSNYGISKADELATEDSPLNPISLYAQTKVKAERFVLKLDKKRFSPTVLRLATVFGLSPRMRFDLLVGELVKEAFLYGKLSVYKPHSWRPLISVEDVAEAIAAVIKAPLEKIRGEVFNVGIGNYQKIDLADLIQKEIPTLKVHIQDKGDSRDYKVSFDKIKNVLGFVAKCSVEKGIKEIYKSLRWGVFKDPDSYRYTNIGWPESV